jgi:hypothetical protein
VSGSVAEQGGYYLNFNTNAFAMTNAGQAGRHRRATRSTKALKTM